MLKRFGAALAFLAINLAGLAAQNNANIAEIEKNYRFHTAPEFVEIMKKSSISYNMSDAVLGSRQFTRFGLSGTTPVVQSPYLRLIRKPDGTNELKDEQPQGDMKFIIDQGMVKFNASDFPAAISFFQKATQMDPNYFKAWSFLAYAFLNSGNPLQAIGYFKKAVSINSIGYQEHMGLAMAYHKLGDYENALNSITDAFILNRFDESIMDTLSLILSSRNKQLFPQHMIFPFSIEQVSDKKCNIYMIGPDSSTWFSMAVATAVWAMEPEFKKIDSQYLAAGQFNSLKIYEIFLCQQQDMLQRIANKQTLPPLEKRLSDIINDGYLLQVILWDIVGPGTPEVVFLMKPDEMKKLRDYILKYVFVSI